MSSRMSELACAACLVLFICLPVRAQLRPETSDQPAKKPAPKPAKIIVETSPAAQVYLDDAFKGQASPEGRLVIEHLKPGDHTLRVTLPGKKDFEEKLTAAAGQEIKITALLGELPATLLVETSAGASVYLDDAFKGQASAQGRLVIDNAGPGAHTLRVTLAGKKDFEQKLTSVPGQEAKVAATLVPVEPPRPAAGAVKQNSKDGLNYVWIPPGTFTMGCSPGDSDCYYDERPAHQVTITKGFWIGQTPVTVGAYKRFAAATGRQMPSVPSIYADWTNDDRPIIDVSWNDSQAYCQWSGGRLPTEAESEYAARGGSTEARYGPIDDIAWYADNSGTQRLDTVQIWKGDRATYVKRLQENGNGTHAVAQKRANSFGLYDTLGNVWEWVNDWYDAGYYQNIPSKDPQGPSSGQLRVLRGGSWFGVPKDVRVSNRTRFEPDYRGLFIGFRCGGDGALP